MVGLFAAGSFYYSLVILKVCLIHCQEATRQQNGSVSLGIMVGLFVVCSFCFSLRSNLVNMFLVFQYEEGFHQKFSQSAHCKDLLHSFKVLLKMFIDMSRFMRKPAFCYINNTIPLLPKHKTSSL